MANSDFFEDLLFEIHKNGLFDEVVKIVKEIRKEKPFIENTLVYEIAYERVLKEKQKKV